MHMRLLWSYIYVLYSLLLILQIYMDNIQTANLFLLLCMVNATLFRMQTFFTATQPMKYGNMNENRNRITATMVADSKGGF
jgi:hypothetical protein